MNMFLQLDHIPQLHNIYAFISTYILLAGYIVFPGTFTSIRNSSAVEGVAGKSHAGQTVFKAVQNVPLLVIAALCCVAGVVGMCLLWWIYQDNFIWLRQKIFLFVRFYYICTTSLTIHSPALTNSATGLLTTLINIYTARKGSWSVTAATTATIAGFFTLLNLGLFVYYSWLLDKVQKEHEKDTAQAASDSVMQEK